MGATSQVAHGELHGAKMCLLTRRVKPSTRNRRHPDPSSAI